MHTNKKLRCLTCCLFTLFMCSYLSCSERVNLPKGVTGIYIELVDNDTSEYSDLFEMEYVIDGKVVTNKKPGPGKKYKVRSKFRGKVVPLVVKNNGTLDMPMRYYVTSLPFGQSEVGPWRTGGPEGVSAPPGLYWFKFRANERGLVFAVVPRQRENIWIYPRDLKPIVPASIKKHIESHGQSVPCVEIPSISSLLKTTNTLEQIVQCTIVNGQLLEGSDTPEYINPPSQNQCTNKDSDEANH